MKLSGGSSPVAMIARLALPLVTALLLLMGIGLVLVAAQGSFNLTRVTTAPVAGQNSSQASISGDGTRIAFHSQCDFLAQGNVVDYEIWLYDTQTLTLTRVTTATPSGRTNFAPSISQDGARIAFVSDSDFLGQGIGPDEFQIWLYDTSTMTVTRVTTMPSMGGRACWSPRINGDGSRIAFESDADFLGQGIPDNQGEIWMYDTATMTLTRLTTATNSFLSSHDSSMNQDGTLVVFHSASDFLGQGLSPGQTEIWMYDTAAMTVTRITTGTPDGRNSRNPRISRDGSRIVFLSDADFLAQGNPPFQSEVWLYDMSTMTVTQLTTAVPAGRYSSSPELNRDGNRIAFSSNSDFLAQGNVAAGAPEIWVYDTGTMTVTRVTTASPADRHSYNPSIDDRGNRIAFDGDSDFLGQSIPYNQFEVWLADLVEIERYLPILLK